MLDSGSCDVKAGRLLDSDPQEIRSAPDTGFLGCHYFCSGRRLISLMKLCGPSVTIAATAWATSSACSIVAGFRPECVENSVATLPGQIAQTRMPCARNSSAMQLFSPIRPHFDAQYSPPFGEGVFPSQRADIDDVAAAPRDHSGRHGAAHQEDRLEIGVQHRVPFRLAALVKQAQRCPYRRCSPGCPAGPVRLRLSGPSWQRRPRE